MNASLKMSMALGLLMAMPLSALPGLGAPGQEVGQKLDIAGSPISAKPGRSRSR